MEATDEIPLITEKYSLMAHQLITLGCSVWLIIATFNFIIMTERKTVTLLHAPIYRLKGMLPIAKLLLIFLHINLPTKSQKI